MAFYFKNSKKDIILTEEDEEDYKNNNILDFERKILNMIKLEIIVILLVYTGIQLIVNVIIMSHKNKKF